MYAHRNSLTILAILLLLVAIGFFWYRNEAEALEEISRQNNELKKRLDSTLEVEVTLPELEASNVSAQEEWQQSSKRIIHADEPAFSLSYIDWLIKMHGLALDFDFFLNDKKDQKDFTTFSYTLTGEGNYRHFSSLVWCLTNYPLLYQIKNVHIKHSEDNPDLLNFTMMLEGYVPSENMAIDSEIAMSPEKLDWRNEFKHDVFASLLPKPKKEPIKFYPEPVRKVVDKPKPKPRKPKPRPGLVDVESSKLVAITRSSAYLRTKNKKVVPLKPGDEVQYGKLTRIDQNMNQVEFLLTTEMGTRVVRLNLEYN